MVWGWVRGQGATRWRLSDDSPQCSAQCGFGHQQRAVRCSGHTGQPSRECAEALRPPATQQCEAKCDSAPPGDGPEGTWGGRPWGGGGHQEGPVERNRRRAQEP